MNKIEFGYCHCGCGNKTSIAPRNWKSQGIKKGNPMKFIHGHNTPWNKGKRYSMKHPRQFKKGQVPWNKGKTHEAIRGERHYNWKGGITEADHAERVRFKRTIQKQIFERDNYTCQICGERSKPIQVDHIQPWAEYVSLRFDINNCRTLCMECHYKITFGRPMSKKAKVWGFNLGRRMLT